MTVGELLSRVDSRELTEWAAYEREFGPLGPERGDWQAAVVATTVAAALSSSNAPRPKLTDFLLSWGRPRRQTGEEQLAIFEGLKARFQSKDVTRGDNR